MNKYDCLFARIRNNCRRGSRHRLLFLDFDGVINVPYAPGTPEVEKAMQGLTDDFFRPEMVKRINCLCQEYGLSVVITSSWRYSGMHYCIDHLFRAGFDQRIAIEGMTDINDPLFRREEEIYRYLRGAKDVGAFLILDDIPMEFLGDYAVCTDFEIGYDETCDKRARDLLEAMIHPGSAVTMQAWDTMLEWTGTILSELKEGHL